MSVFVLREDRAISPIAKFGPHAFLTACVAARLGVSRYDLARAETLGGKSCAGNANVLRELQRGPLWDANVDVVAVLDTDKLHDRIAGISSRHMVDDAAYESWADAVATEVGKHAPAHARLEVCLLDLNLETLLLAIGHGMRELDDALAKRLLQRDKLLHRAAGDPSLIERACAAIPSWERLVATVSRLLSSPG